MDSSKIITNPWMACLDNEYSWVKSKESSIYKLMFPHKRDLFIFNDRMISKSVNGIDSIMCVQCVKRKT